MSSDMGSDMAEGEVVGRILLFSASKGGTDFVEFSELSVSILLAIRSLSATNSRICPCLGLLNCLELNAISGDET